MSTQPPLYPLPSPIKHQYLGHYLCSDSVCDSKSIHNSPAAVLITSKSKCSKNYGRIMFCTVNVLLTLRGIAIAQH